MGTELHIRLHSDVFDSPTDLLSDFPFEPGQSILSAVGDLVIIDLADFEDTTDIQEWYLNRLDEVFSFYVVGE